MRSSTGPLKTQTLKSCLRSGFTRTGSSVFTPGWELITGWEKVQESWQRIFSNTRGMPVAISDIAIRIEGDFALLTCSEHLALFLDSGSAPASATTIATNLYCRAGEKWLMVHHHASQIPGTMPINESDTIQ